MPEMTYGCAHKTREMKLSATDVVGESELNNTRHS